MRKCFFYANNGMVASTNPEWPQTMFDTLVCHSCRAFGVREDEAYTRQMTGAGSSYKEI